MNNYLLKCKEIYSKRIYPWIEGVKSNIDYIDLMAIARSIIADNGIDYFSGYLQEGQYYVDLITAHLMLEYPLDEELKRLAISIIRNYSASELNEQLAEKEKNWLINHGY